MPTDFEKRFGDYGDLTDPMGLGPASMESGQYPNKPVEDQTTRLIRLMGKGATFGLAQSGQDPIEATTIPEHLAEFGGSIPSTVLASSIAGPVLGMAVPRLATLAPMARSAITAGALGSAVGTGRALKSGNITDIPEEAAWWGLSDIVGHGLFKGAAKFFGRGAKLEAPKPPEGVFHGPTMPSAAEREFYQMLEEQKNIDKGNIVNRLLNPDALDTTVPGERVVMPSTGPRTFLPPPEIHGNFLGEEGPAVRLIKIGEEPVDFNEIPELTFGKTPAPGPRMVELHRAEAPGTTGDTFTTDRIAALRDAKTVDGYLKTIEVPEGDLAKYQVGSKYKVPHAVQKEVGVGEHEPMDVPYYEKQVGKEAGAKLRPPRAEAAMSLEDEFGRTVAEKRTPLFSEEEIQTAIKKSRFLTEQEVRDISLTPRDEISQKFHDAAQEESRLFTEKDAGANAAHQRATLYYDLMQKDLQARNAPQQRPLTPGEAAQQTYTNMGPVDPNAPAFRVVPPPTYQPIQRPSLDGFVEKPHENPIRAENMAKPLKEVVDPVTKVTMVAPKTPKSAYIMDMAGNIVRNVEPPITGPMRSDLASPLNKAKLDHGIQMEQYRTSNLIKKSDEAIDLITKDTEGRLVVKPLKFVSIEESPQSLKASKNLERQGIPPAEMQAFLAQKNAQWDAAMKEKSDLQINSPKGSTLTESKNQWMKGQILAELKRRGPC